MWDGLGSWNQVAERPKLEPESTSLLPGPITIYRMLRDLALNVMLYAI